MKCFYFILSGEYSFLEMKTRRKHSALLDLRLPQRQGYLVQPTWFLPRPSLGPPLLPQAPGSEKDG